MNDDTGFILSESIPPDKTTDANELAPIIQHLPEIGDGAPRDLKGIKVLAIKFVQE